MLQAVPSGLFRASIISGACRALEMECSHIACNCVSVLEVYTGIHQPEYILLPVYIKTIYLPPKTHSRDPIPIIPLPSPRQTVTHVVPVAGCWSHICVRGNAFNLFGTTGKYRVTLALRHFSAKRRCEATPRLSNLPPSRSREESRVKSQNSGTC